MIPMGALFRRARYVFKTEGLGVLLGRGFSYLRRYLAREFFRSGSYYLYEHMTKERLESDFMPKIDNFTFHLVSSQQEAEKLAAGGLDLLSQSVGAVRKLENGAIGFCFFVGQELAHEGWVALTEEAKRRVDPLPYHVDFLNKEACTGATYTKPKYRGKGFMAYSYYKRLEYLRGRGIVKSRNAVAANNIASQKAHAKLEPAIYARARYLKILCWEFWREIPLTNASHS